MERSGEGYRGGKSHASLRFASLKLDQGQRFQTTQLHDSRIPSSQCQDEEKEQREDSKRRAGAPGDRGAVGDHQISEVGGSEAVIDCTLDILHSVRGVRGGVHLSIFPILIRPLVDSSPRNLSFFSFRKYLPIVLCDFHHCFLLLRIDLLIWKHWHTQDHLELFSSLEFRRDVLLDQHLSRIFHHFSSPLLDAFWKYHLLIVGLVH